MDAPNPFRLILVDPKPDLGQAWQEKFAPYPRVEMVCGRFEQLPAFDCMVSAANSFGLMDGGVDYAISAFFGWDLQRRVQRTIIDEYLGEQPVGTSFIVPTGHPRHPFVAHTPTMRAPMPITRTDNVYLAMFAMLRAVQRHNEQSETKISVVACPGLGTSAGRVPPPEAARQMALAYKHFLYPPQHIDWAYANQRQDEVIFGGDLWGK
jgi:O-acetyl-ADP-ribose deacetylase (regulator of RNase III)